MLLLLVVVLLELGLLLLNELLLDLQVVPQLLVLLLEGLFALEVDLGFGLVLVLGEESVCALGHVVDLRPSFARGVGLRGVEFFR